MRIKSNGLGITSFRKDFRELAWLSVTTMTFFLCGCSTHHKPDATTASANVSGSWRVTIPRPDGAITGMGSFKQIGHDVTGWVGPSQDQPIRITGVVQENQFTFRTFPEPGRNVAFDRCSVTVSSDKMTGTIEGGDVSHGTIDFVKATQ
jgi:hypothetical protein